MAVGLTYTNHQETINLIFCFFLVWIICVLQVEQHLGQIDTWPTYVIRYVFIDVPKPSIVRKLTAFFYGKDIPVSIASQLYNVCNDKYNLQVTEYICDLHSHGQRCRYKFHMSEYYNVRLYKFIWIIGTALNQLEKVKPEVTVIDFGIDCTGCSSLIRNKLKVVKHVWNMTSQSMNDVPLIKTINLVFNYFIIFIMTSVTSHSSISLN